MILAQDIQHILDSLVQIDDLSRLRDRLRPILQLSAYNQAMNPLGQSAELREYLRLLFEFSNNMVEIDVKMRDARSSLSSGDTGQAMADLKQLKGLRDQTRSLLQSLYTLLNRAAYEGYDATAELKKIGELDARFQTYVQQIDQLGAQLRMQQELISTTLSLYSSQTEVFVEEVLSIYGFLRMENGTALTGRNINVSWGSNKTVKVTDSLGRFEAIISFPAGFPAGSAGIDANFQPEGSDSAAYLPSSSRLEIQVRYHASVIDVTISPAKVRPLDSVQVEGNLTTPGGTPLGFRMIEIRLDEESLGNASTSAIGRFLFVFSVPKTISNGTHYVTVAFNAVGDRFAPSNATLPLTVGLLTAQVEVRVDRESLFSGTKLTVEGNVKLTNGTAWRNGHVGLFFDDFFYTNAIVKDDGSFLSALEVPTGIPSGSHRVKVEYYPDESWIEASPATVQVSVYNTPLIVFASLAILGVLSLGASVVLRNRPGAVLAPPQLVQPGAVEKPLLKEEYSLERLTSTIEAEPDEAAKVKRSYRLAQTLIGEALGEVPRESETHWEYFSRVTSKAPALTDSLKSLAELFELAEYSQYPVESGQAREAREILLRLRDEIEAVR